MASFVLFATIKDVADLLIANWPIVLTSALGFAAVYLLLPRPRRYPAGYAWSLGILALVALALLLIRTNFGRAETVLFCGFSGLAIVFAALMLSQSNPVHAALSFAMVVLSTCGLFLLQAAPFLMAATIIIYAGAIVVTFLFVLMLAQQDGQSNADHRSREPLLASAAGFILLGCLLAVLHSTYGGLDEFVDRAKQAAEASTVKEWEPIVGKDDDFFKSFRKVVLRTREGRPPDLSDPVSIARANLADTLEEARRNWNAIKTADQPNERFPLVATEFKKQMAEIVELAHIVRVNQGTLLPSSQLPLSRFAGSPASEPARTDNSGRPLERLPAANVAGLGKTLFTDYLLAVELGGTLLFVAVIGTIAIAGRRPEGLR